MPLKKKKKKSKEELDRQSLKRTSVLTLIFLVVLGFGILKNGAFGGKGVISRYINNKSSIAYLLGGVQSSEFLDFPKNASDGSVHGFTARIKGKKGQGTLNGRIQKSGSQYTLSGLVLTHNDKTYNLSPTFVDDFDLKGAESGWGARFKSGEEILIAAELKGFSSAYAQKAIQQSVTITNAKTEKVVQSLNQADLVKNPGPKSLAQGLDYRTTLKPLEPGTYNVRSIFQVPGEGTLDVLSQTIVVDEASSVAKLSSEDREKKAPQKSTESDKKTGAVSDDQTADLELYADPAFNQSIKESYPAQKKFFWRLNMDGLETKDNQVNAAIDLKIKNGAGQTIFSKPDYVVIQKSAPKAGPLVIDRPLKLDDPDVYFLHFEVHDKVANKSNKFQKKIVVKLDDPLQKPARE